MPLDVDSIQYGPWRTVRYDIPVEDCAPDELSDMENARIGTGGEVEPRLGTLSYSGESAISGTPTLNLAVEFKPTATTTHVVIAAGAALYRYNSGWVDITGSTTITAGNDNTFEWADANGTLVMTNGVDTDAIKWTGSGNASALNDNARFSRGKHIAWFDNRLWIGNVNGATGQLWYSDIADIETWGATSFFNFGGIIRGLVPTQNALTVHTTDGIYTIIPTGNSVNPFITNQRTGSNQDRPLAAADGRSIVAVPNDVQLMVMDDGIYEWTGGASISKISQGLDGGYWDTINKARLSQSFALYHPDKNEVWFALPYGGSQTNMNHIMVFNTMRRGWHGPYKGWERNCAGLISGIPHLGDFGGILWDHESGDDDNGAAIASLFETCAQSPYGADVKVRWRQARHFFDGKGAWSVAAVQGSVDTAGSTESIPMRGAGFLLGSDLVGGPVIMQPQGMISVDAPLTGYSPTSSIKISLNAKDQTYTYRKILMRFKPLGRFGKPKPVDI
tara:strand:- start:1521 stop:3032 length:1512 start_codon:yes stop_codon:yes gene_type:complete